MFRPAASPYNVGVVAVTGMIYLVKLTNAFPSAII